MLLTALLVASTGTIFASTDSKIEDAAKASYNYKTVLDNKVNISVNDGVVTLTGVVADRDLKSLAEDTVSNLPGVVRVDNQITLQQGAETHSDSWIALKLRTQLLISANVSASTTKVHVVNGVVTLTGTATTQAQRELTGEYAKNIDWVKSVHNQITLVAPSTPDMMNTTSAAVDDASITSQVKYALLTHKSTSAVKTQVTTNNGVVVLAGTAANDAERTLVGKLTQNIRGVKSVENNMTLKEQTPN